MRNLRSKVQPAVYDLKWENGKTNSNKQYLIEDAKPENANCNQQYLIEDAKPENANCNQQYLIHDEKLEKQTATSII